MSAFLESQITTYPDLGDKYNDLLDLFNAKKWHQLTIAVTTFVNTPANYRDVNLNVVTLFNSFVSQFDSKCNQLALAKIAATVAASYGEDAASGRTLLETLLEKRGRLGPQASLYLDMTLTLVLLSTGDMGSVKKMIAERYGRTSDEATSDEQVKQAAQSTRQAAQSTRRAASRCTFLSLAAPSRCSSTPPPLPPPPPPQQGELGSHRGHRGPIVPRRLLQGGRRLPPRSGPARGVLRQRAHVHLVREQGRDGGRREGEWGLALRA